MTEKSTASASVNFSWVGLLGVILVVLKLNPGSHLDSPVENWSWWLVLMPFWLGLAILLAILAVVGIGILVVALIDASNSKRAAKARAARFKR